MRVIEGVSVKRVKVLERASEETLCFEADVYVNGRKLGVASNEGRGGSNRYSSAALEQALAAAAAKLPLVVDATMHDPKEPAKPFSYRPDADDLIMRLVDCDQFERLLARAFKKYIVSTSGAGTMIKYGPIPPETLARAVAGGEASLRGLVRLRPGETLLNHLSMDAAVDVMIGPKIEAPCHG